MKNDPRRILLADDDSDDAFLFKEVLDELGTNYDLATVTDGVELMRYVQSSTDLPDVLFLDLNMPRKNGFECLTEIKSDDYLRTLPVVIYSTSLDHEVINLLYEKGATHYIRKPGDFQKLKSAIGQALGRIELNGKFVRSKENFLIQV